MLACLRAKLVNTFLGTKLPWPVFRRNVQKKYTKKWEDCGGGVKEVSISVCGRRSTRGGDPSQASADPLGLPGVLVLHVLQSQISGRRLPDRRRETGGEEREERKATYKHCSQTWKKWSQISRSHNLS